MNIFYLHRIPKIAATLHADYHVGKMLMEACQLLATAHLLPDVEGYFQMLPQQRLELDLLPYTHTHINHPCAIWVRSSIYNYHWLLQLGLALAEEFCYRFNKPHKTERIIKWFQKNEHTTFISPSLQPTHPVLAMPIEYRSTDTIESYQRYYNENKQGWWHKSKLKDGRIKAKWFPATWTKRDIPTWFVRKPAPTKPKYHADIVVYAQAS